MIKEYKIKACDINSFLEQTKAEEAKILETGNNANPILLHTLSQLSYVADCEWWRKKCRIHEIVIEN